jgi:hypothetical protein
MLPVKPQTPTNYYKSGNLETIEIIRSKLTIEEYKGFLRGNILKYMTRAGYKPNNPESSDYKKAKYYLDLLNEFIHQ